MSEPGNKEALLPRGGQEVKPYKAGNWRTFVYLAAWPIIQEIGHLNGYSMAIQGTIKHDLDLLATPWTEEAISAEELISKIYERYSTYDTEQFGRDLIGPEKKPHGRLAWMITCGAGLCFDISVMPRIPKEEQHAPEIREEPVG